MARRNAPVIVTLAIVLAAVVLVAPPATARWTCGGPITVSGAPSGWGVGRAAQMWNQTQAGQPHLRQTGAGAAVTVRVVNRPGATWVGRTTFDSSCRHLVELNRGVVARPEYRGHREALRRWTTLHEFGHVLGLHHTSGPSVMRTSGTMWMSGGRITDGDRAALRRLY